MNDFPADSFDQFFCRATGEKSPFEYQRQLAEGSGRECVSRLIDVPTGCGKTAAVVLAWLWNRVAHPDDARRAAWPRRLVYCLPMRTLVEQTHDAVAGWLKNTSDHTPEVRLHVLMGGEKTDDWEAHPEADAVLIGTQDMLLSRALNRGYGSSRYRWPMGFALLNNDCLWVMDETQLMGVGVETSAQLDAFRAKLGTRSPCHCWWMSATLEPGRLATVDHPAPATGWPTLTLGVDERESGAVARRYQARKNLVPASVALAAPTVPATEAYQKELAAFVAEQHVADTFTLVVVNRVPRAQAIYQLLDKARPKGAAVALVHSRFRPGDRRAHEEILFARKQNRIVVATQAVEAGVDVSAHTLVTELAPWSSLVQRFGRCNRYGECGEEGGRIFWIDLPTSDDKATSPYQPADLAAARALLQQPLTAAGPRDLQGMKASEEGLVRPVIRRKDLLDLFDTTADLCGADLDIARYVRDGDDTDVQVYWREVGDEGPSREEGSPDRREPARGELCRVGVDRFTDFLKPKGVRVWRWDALDERWEQVRPGQRAMPGAVYLIAKDQGGYHEKLGWTGNVKDRPSTVASGDEELSAYDGDRWSFAPRRWVGLREHVDQVVQETDCLCKTLNLPAGSSATLRTAAAWHDAGKAHAVFQDMLHAGAPAEWAGRFLAKSGNGSGHSGRRGFRHELVSALLWLQLRAGAREDGDLVAYLIGAHHGKVRLSLRALPDEEKPDPVTNDDGTERLFARGVWDRERVPAPGFGPLEIEGETIPPSALDLAYMRLGSDAQRGDSWLARMIRLRDAEEWGPFRLAFLETLLRVADWRASAKETHAPHSLAKS